MNHAQIPFLQLYRINALRALGGLGFGLLAVTAAPPVAPLASVVFEILGTLAVVVAIAAAPGRCSISAVARTPNS
ncbi:hypothetical protein M1D34_29320 (plasmid) [Ensifer sp. D2-11]